MDINARIKELMKERGWTEYRLAKNANLSQSTVINIFRRNTVPSVATLESICNAFGITLSQFFDDSLFGDKPAPRIAEDELLSLWRRLTDSQRAAILSLMNAIC